MSRKRSVYSRRFFPLADAKIRKTIQAMEVMEGLIDHKVSFIDLMCAGPWHRVAAFMRLIEGVKKWVVVTK